MAKLFVPLDVNFPDDDKIEAVGLDGAGLYAMSLCLAKRLLDDGRLTRVKLRKLGADDPLIDRLIDVGLYTADAGDAVRISAWLGHNAPAESVLTSDRAKRLAHQRHHTNKGVVKPECRFCQSQEPQVNAETCGDDAERMATQCETALPEVEVEVETEIPHSSLRTTPVPEPLKPSHEDEAAAAPPDPNRVPDEQTIRRTAALVGRTVAAAQAGIGNPQAYAAGVTRQILDPQGDGIDRERITRELTTGATPETIAAAWVTDPFGIPNVYPTADTPPDTRPALKPFDRAAHEAEADAQRAALEALDAQRSPDAADPPTGTKGPDKPAKAARTKTGTNRGTLRAVRETA